MPRTMIQRRRRRERARETKRKAAEELVRLRLVPASKAPWPRRPAARRDVPDPLTTAERAWTPGEPYRRRS